MHVKLAKEQEVGLSKLCWCTGLHAELDKDFMIRFSCGLSMHLTLLASFCVQHVEALE